MFYLVVDRIEGGYAVLVADWSGESYNVPRGRFREGQVYRWNGRGWVRDAREEKRRRDAARRTLDELRRTDPGGEIKL